MDQIGLFPSSASEDTIIGGKYRLIEKISEGSGGIVWKATNEHEKEIALKFLKWSPLKSRESATERFKNEFTILKSLSHPNIAKIYNFGFDVDSDLYFFTSELISGGSLKSLLGAPIATIETALLQALRALEYLGNHQLLHLDIKPQNLLLRKNENDINLALIDFGLATFRSPDRPGGTANYMPPELISKRLELGEPYVTPDSRSDLYSLGVTFYYCLTGVQPFCAITKDGRHIDIMATLKNHFQIKPPPPSTIREDIPSYLDRIVMKLMAESPEDRFVSPIVAAQAIMYRSPINHAAESEKTLLAYIPKEGKIVGRKKEILNIERTIKDISSGNGNTSPIICIAGKRGTGRSRLLTAAKPLAQRMEFETITLDVDNWNYDINLATSKHSTLILIDNIDLVFKKQNAKNNPIILDIRSIVKALRIQRALPFETHSRNIMIFSVNTDKTNIEILLSKLEIDQSICKIVPLKNFSDNEVSEYLNTLLGDKPSSSVVKQLMQCTNGNPLFITEHLKEMIAKGRLFSLAGRPDAKTLKTIGIDFSQATPPKIMSEVVLEKVKSLDDDAKKLANTIACWRRHVTADELKSTADTKNFYGALLALTRSGLIKKTLKGKGFLFSSELAKNIVRDTIKKHELKKIHDDIAIFLKTHKHRAKQELTYHLAYGSNPELSISSLQLLADSAQRKGKYLDAIKHLNELKHNIPNDEWKTKVKIISSMGRAYEKMYMYDLAKSTYRKMTKIKTPKKMALNVKLESMELIGRMLLRRRNFKDASRIFTKAIKLSRGKKSLILWRLTIENYLAGIDLREGRIEKALERFKKTDSIAKRTLDKAGRKQIKNNELGEALFRSGQPKAALKRFMFDLKNTEQSDDFERIADKHYLIGNVLRSSKIANYESAMKHYKRALDLAKKRKLPKVMIRVYNGLGNLYLQTSKPRKALAIYRKGFHLSQQVDSYTTSVELMIGMGLAAHNLNRQKDMIEYFETALDFSGSPKGKVAGLIRRYRPTIYVLLGDAYYQLGNTNMALKYLNLAKVIDKKQKLDTNIRYSLYETIVKISMDTDTKMQDAHKIWPTLQSISKTIPEMKSQLKKIAKRLNP